MAITPFALNGACEPILTWLASPSHAEHGEEIAMLLKQLQALHQPSISREQFHRCIELFYSRILRTTVDFRKTLLNCTLPLSDPLQINSKNLIQALAMTVAGFVQVLNEPMPEPDADVPQTSNRLLETAPARALRLLYEQYVLCCHVAMRPPEKMWQTAHQLFFAAHKRTKPDEKNSEETPHEGITLAYKRLLAIATIDPYALAGREFEWANQFLNQHSGLLHLQFNRPPSIEGAWYWATPEHDQEPCSTIRQDPPKTDTLFISTAGLAKRAAELLTKFDSGRRVPELDPAENYSDIQPAALLSRLRQRWSMPSRREQPRRRNEYPVQICSGLDNIWNSLSAPKESSLISEWTVRNESPGGFSILHVQGRIEGLAAGMPIALRREDKESWNICVVRWLRMERSQQIELGLQTVASGAIPIRIGFTSNGQTHLANALVLPVLPALRQHQAILAPTGTYIARRFCLVSDVDRIYIAQGRLLSLDMQTAHIELFQFEIDPYPT